MDGPVRSGKSPRRAFRPTLGGPLEDRLLLSTGRAEIDAIVEQILDGRRNPRASSGRQESAPRATAARARASRHPISTLVLNGGRGVRILEGTGEAFDVRIEGTGTVTARPSRNHDGSVVIVARGTTSSSNLVISPARPTPTRGGAHTFNPSFGAGDELLEVSQIVLRSGRIGQILGFRTVNLSGPIRVAGESTVDRIALNRILPGGTIQTNGDLDTLDIFVSADLAGPGTGIFVGRDLNWTNVRGNLTISDGATINVGRDVGVVGQPQKGTAIGGQGILIQGNLVIEPTGSFHVTRNLSGTPGGSSLAIRGNFNGTSRFTVGGSITQPVSVLGTVTPN